MESLLENYEQQYGILSADITCKIGKILSPTPGDKWQLTSQTERNIEELQELLEQMDLEVRNVPPELRPKHQMRLQSYRAELLRLEKEFQQAKQNTRSEASMRRDLLEDSETRIDVEQRQRLLDNTERLERTGNRLEAGYHMALETEEIGAQILGHLNSQRETIQKSRGRLRETDGDLSHGSRILTGMMVRIAQNRAILWAIGLIMITLIAVGIYYSATK